MNKGALTIKLESEDIIAMHPPDTLSNVDHLKNDKRELSEINNYCDNIVRNRRDINTHLKEIEATQTTYHGNESKSADTNTLPVTLSFQESRTPFYKRLEMLSRGISSKPSNTPSSSSSEEWLTNYSLNLKKEKAGEIEDDSGFANSSNSHQQNGVNVFEENGQLESKIVIDQNDSDHNLMIDEDCGSDQNESRSNKRIRLDRNDSGGVSPGSTFIPVAPIPTILGLTSEDNTVTNQGKAKPPPRKSRAKRRK